MSERPNPDRIIGLLEVMAQTEPAAGKAPWQYGNDTPMQTDAAWAVQVLKEHRQQSPSMVEANARRYEAFFQAGLPVTFHGEDYANKAALDTAIDRFLAKG